MDRKTNATYTYNNPQSLPQSYEGVLKQFLQFQTQNSLPLNTDTIRRFINLPKIKGNGEYSEASKAFRKCAVFVALKQITHDTRVKAYLTEESKMIKVAKVHRAIYKEKILSWEEIHKLIFKSKLLDKGKDNKYHRLSLIIETLAMTGMRISELINIKLKDCLIDGEKVYINIIGKGNKPRRIFLSVNLLSRIKREFNSEALLFLSKQRKKYNRSYLQKEINLLGKLLLSKNHVTCHTFRHSFATREIKRLGCTRPVQLYLGHASSIITEMYNHTTLEYEDLFGC
ncbi:site-specific recombinase XerD [Leptospira meyeri]|uniref:Site-specific recombinase XerD n=1 Tax=Leptospira meyeri TaxID=29508 RepID=A0A4R8MMX7_LEPME|nr:tyrosine-type recombinase/integrase [Leptospira meyeri]EKJ86162.1 site-specific recombinase, phage integrase family [Leptospira meyeri serovar Hardjo str. Went 5]TDY66549.1 site-specific recombinase XerD [Leptospira meyeri]